MNQYIADILELVLIFVFVILFFYIRYRFPHFSMHFFDGISKFGINSFDFESNCKKHSRADIEKYKKRQKNYITGLVILSSIVIFGYIIYDYYS